MCDTITVLVELAVRPNLDLEIVDTRSRREFERGLFWNPLGVLLDKLMKKRY